MASIQLPKNQNTYNASVKIWDESRKAFRWACWSTGKTCKKEAQIVADAYQEGASKLYPDCPDRNDSTHLRRIFRIMCERAGVFVDDMGDGPSFSSFAGDWLKRRQEKTKDSTGETYRAAVNNFSKHLGEDGDIPMGRITATMIQQWYDGLIEKGRATGTAKNNYVVIASIFKRAHEMGSIRINPAAPIEVHSVVQEERKPFTQEEEDKIFDFLQVTNQTDWLTACMLARWAFLRLSDAANFSWTSIEEKGDHTILSYIPKKKANRAGKGRLVVIPALGPLPAYIRNLQPKEGMICPKLAGTPVGGKNGLSAQFAMILESTGIDRQRLDRIDGRRTFCALSP